jgi:hypothetical protein
MIKIGWMMGLFGTAAVLTGCAAPSYHAMVGTAQATYAEFDVSVGDPWREFSFVDLNGEVQTFSGVRGRVTVLVFADQGQVADCAMIQKLDEITIRAYCPWVPVKIVYVTDPNTQQAGAENLAAVCELKRPRTVVISDQNGDVRRLYGGDQARGKYVVLNNFLDVTKIGDADDLEALEADAEALAREIHDQDNREGGWKWVG